MKISVVTCKCTISFPIVGKNRVSIYLNIKYYIEVVSYGSDAFILNRFPPKVAFFFQIHNLVLKNT